MTKDCVFDDDLRCIYCGYQARKPNTRRNCGVKERPAPGVFDRVSRYASAVARWIEAGSPTRKDDEVEAILATCQGCEHYDGAACRKCGCSVNRSAWGLLNKARMATEACPVDKWGLESPAALRVDQRLKVAFVVPNLGLGGVEQWLRNLCKAWHGSPDVRVVGVAHVGGTSYVDATVVADIARYAPIVSTVRDAPVHRVATAAEAVYAVGRSADVLIVWSVGGELLDAIKAIGKPVVGVSHGCSDWWMRDAVSVVNHWAAVSPGAALVVPVPCPAESAQVLANGIDLDRLIPTTSRAETLAAAGIPESAQVVVSLSRLSAEKRLDRIAESMCHWPDDAWYWIVGSGPHRDAIIAACTRPERLVVSEARPDIGNVLVAATIAVMASESEGHSFAADECLAAGVPLVSTRAGVLASYLDVDRAVMWLADDPRPESIGRTVTQALGRIDVLRRETERLGSWIRTEHSAGAMAERWKVYVMTQAAVRPLPSAATTTPRAPTRQRR